MCKKGGVAACAGPWKFFPESEVVISSFLLGIVVDDKTWWGGAPSDMVSVGMKDRVGVGRSHRGGTNAGPKWAVGWHSGANARRGMMVMEERLIGGGRYPTRGCGVRGGSRD